MFNISIAIKTPKGEKQIFLKSGTYFKPKDDGFSYATCTIKQVRYLELALGAERKEYRPDDVKFEEELIEEEDLKFNELIVNIDKLGADDVKFVAAHLEIEYTTKKETLPKIKEFLNI